MNTQTITPELIREYRKARERKPFMIVGQDAVASLDAARIILKFRELEEEGRVRIRAEHEQESYFDVFGRPETQREIDAIAEQLDRLGVWWVTTEVLHGCDRCGDERWEHADSIGMCISKDPCDPYDNCYVVDLMREAIEQCEAIPAK